MTNILNKIMHNGDEYQFPDTTYSAWDGINIDANNEISNTQPWPIVSANQPSSASEWDLWYDTANDELKVYDGSQRNVAGGATYTAGKWIAILNGTDYSAMRWPCDEWYHVPNETELTALITALTTLWLTLVDTTAQTYLLMPLAWMRARNDGSVSAQWTEWHYRSCDSASLNRAKRLQIDSYDIAVGWTPIAIWASIRPFKDEAVIPDSWRTTLYAGTWDAGIFHNSTDGIISISADGTTWMTIADKNLWATTVYNYWDTESQANCGNYYQWWNNYGFAWTWAVTTSSTQVDASSYWPSEYSSSTFITDSPRDYPRNLDLWWVVTGTTQNNNAITNLWVLVSDQANNIFTPWMKIWGWTQSDYQSLTPESNTAYLLLADQPTPPSPWRQPWVNTIAYYPFKSDILDYSWNHNDFTTWSWTYSNNMITTTSNLKWASAVLWSHSWDFTYSIWIDYDNTDSSTITEIAMCATNDFAPSLVFWWPNNDWWYAWIFTTSWCVPTYSWAMTWIHCIHLVRDNWTLYLYVDADMKTSISASGAIQNNQYTIVGWYQDQSKQVTCGNLIVEDKARTAQEIQDYYNATKWDYWIS